MFITWYIYNIFRHIEFSIKWGCLDMEYRKLVSSGRSSHIISLPSQWLKKNNLGKGDTIYLDISNTDIVLYPKEISAEKEEIKHNINIEGLSMEIIERRMVSEYINNVDLITLTGEDLSTKTKEIKRIIQNFIALEIISQTNNTLVAKSFLKINDVDINYLIRKTDHILTTMFNDLIEITENPQSKAIEISENISQRDEDLNRIYFLIIRTINYYLKNNGRINKNNKFSEGLLQMWGRAFFLEQVADEIKRISRLLVKLDNKSFLKDYTKILNVAKQNHQECMKAFYKKDTELVYKVSNYRNRLLNECDEFQKSDNSNPLSFAILDRTKNMIAKIHNINRMSY